MTVGGDFFQMISKQLLTSMEKIRFGVIGTNFITDWVIAGARQDPRFELSAVCSRTRERADAFADRYGIPYRYTSLEEMAESPHVDAVYIATPNSLHASQAILCMSRGRHVLCEKPLASNAAEVREMAAASEKYGVTLMEAMKSTLTPNFRVLAEGLGKIGRVRRYVASYCQYSSRYDLFRSGHLTNTFNPEYSNGAVMDIGVYTIYPMVVLFGAPLQVSASATLLPSGVDGQGTAVFRYDGMEASVAYSKISDSYLPSEIQGEEGTIVIDHISRMDRLSFIPRSTGNADRRGKTCPEDWSLPSARDVYYYEVAEFIDLVLSGRRESSVNTHRNSLLVISLIDEIRRQTGVVFPADGR